MKKIFRKQAESEMKVLSKEDMFSIRGGKDKVEKPRTPNGTIVVI